MNVLYLETDKYFYGPHQKVYDFIRKNDSYICREACTNMDYSSGVPMVMSTVVGKGGNTQKGSYFTTLSLLEVAVVVEVCRRLP